MPNFKRKYRKAINCKYWYNTLVEYNYESVLSKINEIENGTYKTGEIPQFWDGKSTKRIVEILYKELNS